MLRLLLLVVLVSLLGCWVGSGRAAVVSWVNTDGGSWGVASNWNTSSVPNANDTVYLYIFDQVNGTAVINVSLNGGSFSVAALYLGLINATEKGNRNVSLSGPGELMVSGGFYCGGVLGGSIRLTSLSQFMTIKGCALGDGVALTSSGTADIQGVVPMGNQVNITNKGYFGLHGLGLYDTSNNPSNYFVNEGTLVISDSDGSLPTVLSANLINNGGTVRVSTFSVVTGGITNNNGNFTHEDGSFTLGNAGFVQSGSSAFTNITSDITSPVINILSGTLLVSASNGVIVHLVGNLTLSGGIFLVDSLGSPVEIIGAFTQLGSAKLNLTYYANNEGTSGLSISNLDDSKDMVCDLSGEFTLRYVDTGIQGLKVYPPFGVPVAALRCAVNNLTQSHIAYDNVTLIQPALGKIAPITANYYVGFIPTYNITFTLKSKAVTKFGGAYSFLTTIAENNAPAPQVSILLQLSSIHGSVKITNDVISSNYLGQAQGYVDYPSDADVSYTLQAHVIGCVNANPSTCSLSSSGVYSGAQSKNWIQSHWWIIAVAAGAGIGAIGIGALVTCNYYRRGYLRRRSYSHINEEGGHHHH